MGRNAPEYLLYTTSPASAELALAITRAYAEVDRGLQFRLLHRRAIPLNVRKRVVFDKLVDARHTVEIPREWRDHAVIAEVRYQKTFSNAVLSLLYQPAESLVVLFQGSSVLARIRMNSLLSGEGIVLSNRPGVWDGRPSAMHGMRFGLLTDERLDATAIGFDAEGLGRGRWDRYFSSEVHLRIYIPEFSANVNHGMADHAPNPPAPSSSTPLGRAARDPRAVPP